jgi:hypothetical protein
MRRNNILANSWNSWNARRSKMEDGKQKVQDRRKSKKKFKKQDRWR